MISYSVFTIGGRVGRPEHGPESMEQFLWRKVRGVVEAIWAVQCVACPCMYGRYDIVKSRNATILILSRLVPFYW